MPIFRMNDDGDVTLRPGPITHGTNCGCCPKNSDAPPLLGVEPQSDEWYIKQAIEQYASDEIEFDDALTPRVSVGEDGAWVAAWVFVAKPDEDDEPGPGMVNCDDCGEENLAGNPCACEREDAAEANAPDDDDEPEAGRGTRAWHDAKDRQEQDFREGA